MPRQIPSPKIYRPKSCRFKIFLPPHRSRRHSMSFASHCPLARHRAKIFRRPAVAKISTPPRAYRRAVYGFIRAPQNAVSANIASLAEPRRLCCRFEISQCRSGLNFTLLHELRFICHRRRNCVSFAVALNLQRRSGLNSIASALW